MTSFGQYAQYYDLLYGDKDYRAEADYVERLLRCHAPDARSLLELGSGTGVHASLLAKSGFEVHGIDKSEDMLARADDLRSTLSPEVAARMSFARGDITDCRLERFFDAVLSLFHVMSYQVENEGLASAFATASAHLRTGGIFIFDCWYGPAVLTDRPTLRVKRMKDESIDVTRIAEPTLYPSRNQVDVRYEVFIRDRQTGSVEVIEEVHHMRYLFGPEVESLLAAAELELVASEEWMSGRELGFDTWGACFVTRRK